MLLNIHENDRVALLVDGQGTHASFANNNLDIDYKALLAEFDGLRLSQANYFTPITAAAGEFNPIHPLLQFLSLNGYTVNSANKDRGANMNVEITIRAMTLAQTNDVIILMVGSSDMVPLVEAIRAMGRRVIVMHHSDSTSMELRRVADEFIPLDKVPNKIIKPRQQTFAGAK